MNRKYLSADNDDDENSMFPSPEKRKLNFSVKSSSFHNFTVHLSEAMYDADYYTKIFDLMLEAGENDIIDIMIASPGGNLAGLTTLIEGIRLTDAHVRAVLIGECFSCASILAMHCHEVVVTDSCQMLVHCVRTGFGGKIVDMEAFTNHTKKVTDRLFHETYYGFLESSEIDAVLRGSEIWLDADQVRARLERRQALFEEKASEIKPVEPAPKKPTRKKKEPSQE